MNFTVAGWGATESAPTSEVLLDSNLNYTLNAECERKFRQRVFQFRSQSFTSLMADLPSRHKTEFIHLACALMEHFLGGIALLRHWYINSNEKSTYQSLNRTLPSRK